MAYTRPSLHAAIRNDTNSSQDAYDDNYDQQLNDREPTAVIHALACSLCVTFDIRSGVNFRCML
jgi:hypothetical protein